MNLQRRAAYALTFLCGFSIAVRAQDPARRLAAMDEFQLQTATDPHICANIFPP